MPITYIIIGFTAIVSYIALSRVQVMNSLLFYPYIIYQNFEKEYFRFISYGFIHADLGHLIFNMLTLYFFGTYLEHYLGNTEFMAFYFSSLIVSVLYSYYKNRLDPEYKALGASGAVASILFANLIINPWETIYIKFIIPVPFIMFALFYIGYSYYMNRNKSDNIGHDVHLAGAIYGFAYMAIAHPDLYTGFIKKLMHPSFNP